MTNQVFSDHQNPNNNYLLTNTNRSQYSTNSGSSYYSPTTTTNNNNNNNYSTSPSSSIVTRHGFIGRPKLTTTLWEDEGTICYQVDANGICVARRQDNDMINGTKLLNVAGMSRGKRDGILKNEKGRVVIKIGAMHLKGVWISFDRAKILSAQYKIQDLLYPLFVDDPTSFLYTSSSSLHGNRTNYGNLYNNNNNNNNNRPYYGLSTSLWDRPSQDLTSNTQTGIS
ncbi:transcription regulator HTH, apses-type DNA-binding domain-containing protein [Cokeromyces recurvatus]|uniref:transcription regulator HTH, apses-type DNA-binding domain-containing protein n=1 Tax=Cokeromyces recurvatus TaxID=90255 RepID=UPI0022211146|nr:transcription regulator HTH, apses-type DNA-binding domain-containing protein [Cokeromyces recurvatus]KAI7902976.1 transcription regulator HTH, apses-type DNA-binding domain-containing protein [Cokeromyces recurvatus]